MMSPAVATRVSNFDVGIGLLMFLSAGLLYGLVEPSQFDPHLFPESGPFFEGWYIRLNDFENSQTFGVLFGRVLSREESFTQSKSSPGLVSVLYRDFTNSQKRLNSCNAFLEYDQINVTVKDGKPVTHNPDYRSPAHFSWRGDHVGYIHVHPTFAYFTFKVEHLRFSAKLGSPVPWGSSGLGLEGLLSYLPLPLHWFVYSLRSPVIQYELYDYKSGKKISGNSGVAHMEKNWGKSFPKAWIWIEGTSEQDIVLSLSGGLVTFGKQIDVPAYLIGYRNPLKHITLNFNPVDSVVWVEQNGCNGSVSIVVKGLTHVFDVNVTGALYTFSDCLYGPEERGFERACVESYDAVASILVKKRHLFHEEIVDSQLIHNVALEFGGEYVCNKTCRVRL